MFSPYRDRIAPLRVIDPNGLYHVMSRGNFRATIFLDEHHYAKYLELLTRVAKRQSWCVLDWCLIPNHYHLLIQLTDDGLSAGMRELNGCFSRWSNLQTGRTRTGHVVKNRFGSVEMAEEGHLFEVMRYIPNNPVKAGLVQQPADWPWSGYRATVGIENPFPFHRPAELLSYFGPDSGEALRRYRSFVQEGRDQKDRADALGPPVSKAMSQHATNWSDQV
jgi:REP element-mobilizing transposase RayT